MGQSSPRLSWLLAEIVDCRCVRIENIDNISLHVEYDQLEERNMTLPTNASRVNGDDHTYKVVQ